MTDRSDKEALRYAVAQAGKSPMGFFALVVVACNTLFGAVGAIAGNPNAVVYTMHMFLAIVGAFILIALWSPQTLYVPRDVKDIEADNLVDKTGRVVVTVVLGAALVLYMAYRLITDLFPNPVAG